MKAESFNPSTPTLSPEERAARSKRTLGIVFLTVFLDLIGFGIIIPIQPFYAQTLGAEPALITLLGASFSLMQFVFSPVWGKLSDRVGRRPVMLISIAMSSVGYLMFALSHSLPMLFVARMLAGLGGANIGTAQAIIADSTPKESRAKGMGLIGAAFGLGFIFGPALGGFFVRFGLSVPIFIAAGLCAANWLLAVFILPETYHLRNGKSGPSHPGFSWAALKHAARHPGVARLFSLYLYFSVAFSMMEQVLALYVEKTWLRDSTEAPVTLATHAATMTTQLLVVVGVTAVIVQGGLIGHLVKRFGERRLLVAGMSSVALALLLVPFTEYFGPFIYLVLLMIPMAFGAGITNPSLSSLLSQSVNADEQGSSLGLGQSLAALGRVIGPTFSGALFMVHKGLPFWVGGSLMSLSVLVALFSRSPARVPAR